MGEFLFFLMIHTPESIILRGYSHIGSEHFIEPFLIFYFEVNQDLSPGLSCLKQTTGHITEIAKIDILREFPTQLKINGTAPV